MSLKKWVTEEFDRAFINGLADECGIDPFVALLAFSRGYKDPFSVDMFFSKEVPDIDPFAFPDMEKAVSRVNLALNNEELITIFGDYDCDGATSTALMFRFLSSLGAKVDYYIPNRSEGYGMNVEAVEKAAKNGTKLIITVDNGITCLNEIKRASELGIDTIVTDHHLPHDTLPDALAIIDPHCNDTTLDFKDFAGVGVAFMLALAVSNLSPEIMLERYGDLVALGTIADIMPLKCENRGIVMAGIRKMLSSPNLGIKELLVSAGVDVRNINSSSLAFSAAPRINAAGRMGDATRAVELLITDDILKAQRLADELNAENQARQLIEKKIAVAATETVFTQGLEKNRVIVVMGEDWKEGVLGIAAGRLAEFFGKPVILLSKEKDSNIAKGSARSVGDFPLFEAISHCEDLLVKFGGHNMAAGLTIEEEKLADFNNAINEFAMTVIYPMVELKIDCKLNPAAITSDLVLALEPLEPYGAGNPSPLFGLFGMTIVKIFPMGNGKHLRLILSKNNTTVAAVAFNKSLEDFPYKVGAMVDLAVNLQMGEYQGEPQLNIIIKDIKINGRDDNKILNSLLMYEELTSGKISVNTAKELSFERAEMAEIYRAVKGGENTLLKLTENHLHYSFAKICAIVDTMEELGLIETAGYMDSKKITICPTTKVDINNSKIYNTLKCLSIEG